jgi:ABC-type nitrate/sulfonate/bicarbonate transport system ATPase subunit
MIILDSIRSPSSLNSRARVCFSSRLELGVGNVVHIQGENGTGKSTLLRVIAGLEVDYAGVRVVPHNTRFRVIPTNLMELVLPWYSVERNTNLLMRGVPDHGASRDRLDSLIGSFLPSIRHGLGARPVYTLSAGQRAALACAWALAAFPDVIILDETLSYCADGLATRISAALADFTRSGGLLIVAGYRLPGELVSSRQVLLHASDIE